MESGRTLAIGRLLAVALEHPAARVADLISVALKARQDTQSVRFELAAKSLRIRTAGGLLLRGALEQIRKNLGRSHLLRLRRRHRRTRNQSCRDQSSSAAHHLVSPPLFSGSFCFYRAGAGAAGIRGGGAIG
jgi:hypothetical protein